MTYTTIVVEVIVVVIVLVRVFVTVVVIVIDITVDVYSLILIFYGEVIYMIISSILVSDYLYVVLWLIKNYMAVSE
jgi:hypothetical protein